MLSTPTRGVSGSSTWAGGAMKREDVLAVVDEDDAPVRRAGRFGLGFQNRTLKTGLSSRAAAIETTKK